MTFSTGRELLATSHLTIHHPTLPMNNKRYEAKYGYCSRPTGPSAFSVRKIKGIPTPSVKWHVKHQRQRQDPIGIHLPLQIDPRPIPKFCRLPLPLTFGVFIALRKFRTFVLISSRISGEI